MAKEILGLSATERGLIINLVLYMDSAEFSAGVQKTRNVGFHYG